jgi:hypothetical protein
MRNILSISLVGLLSAPSAFASYELSKKRGPVICNGSDNQVITLGSNKATVKYSIEGKSLGSKAVESVVDNRKDKVAYSTEELTLTFADTGDLFKYDGGDEESLRCK